MKKLHIIKKFFNSLKLKFVKRVKFYNVPSPFKYFLGSEDLKTIQSSQHGQDALITKLLLELKLEKKWENGIIVDIGCNDPICFSNSYYFENKYKMFTLAIDPIAEFGQIWENSRPKSKFLNLAIGNSDETLVLNYCKGDKNESMFSSIKLDNVKLDVTHIEERTVKVSKLTNVLLNEGISEVNLLLIDVEGFEEEVFKGIDFTVINFDIILVENNSKNGMGKESIPELLKSNGFIYYARIWNLDDVFINKNLFK